MIDLIQQWFKRYFSDPQIVFLILFLAAILTVIISFNDILAPVFFAVVLAYLLEGIIIKLSHYYKRRMPLVLLVYFSFLSLFFMLSLVVIPLFWEQMSELIKDMPQFIEKGRQLLLTLPEKYSFIDENHVAQIINFIQNELGAMGKRILEYSLSSLQDSVTIIIYLILVPMLIFFFLKDKKQILKWFASFLPKERQLSNRIWGEMDLQIGNYVRGKFWEIMIVGVATYLAFIIMGLKYALLLATLVGLSVIIPYIGATVVTFPVMIVAFFQWGWGSDFAWLMMVYLIIQGIDGNVIVPLLFSEVVNIHPIAIIVAVLFFGGLWGFWGVFFAIPLATLVNSIIQAWPDGDKSLQQEVG